MAHAGERDHAETVASKVSPGNQEHQAGQDPRVRPGIRAKPDQLDLQENRESRFVSCHGNAKCILIDTIL